MTTSMVTTDGSRWNQTSTTESQVSALQNVGTLGFEQVCELVHGFLRQDRW